MTKRDYIAVAQAIAQAPKPTQLCSYTAWSIANAYALHCEAQNPRFNRALFMRACGFDTERELTK